MKNNKPLTYSLFFLLLLLTSVCTAQMQVVAPTTTFQIQLLQQSINKLRIIQTLPASSSSLDDTTSAFGFRQNNSRRNAEGGAMASVAGSAFEPVKISDFKDTLINGTVKSFSYQTIASSSAKILKAYFENISTGGKAFSAATRNSNFSNEIIEVRSYSNAVVKSFELPRMSANSRDIAAFKVEFEAPSVTTTYPGGRETTSRIVSNTRRAFCSNYRTTMSGMTTSNSRISDISAIKITAGSSAVAGVPYQLNDFSIEVATSVVQEYTQWFQSPNRATDLRTFNITYTDAGLRTNLVVVELQGVEIISMSNVSVPSGAIPKTKIGLRPQKIKVTFN